MRPYRHRCIAAALLAAGLAAPAAAQDIEALCAQAAAAGDDFGTCRCALPVVAAEIPADDFALYAEIGAVYFDERSGGAGRADAWEAGVAAAADARGVSNTEIRQKTNEIGRLHADAAKACG